MDRNEIILESQKLDYKLVNGINKMELFKGIEKFNDSNLSLTDFELYKIDEITYEEEEKLLEKFINKADSGQMTDVNQLKEEYIKMVGHSIGGSQIYRLLKRHGYKKSNAKK